MQYMLLKPEHAVWLWHGSHRQHRFHAITESQSCFENISFRSQTQIVPVFKMLSAQKITWEIVIISVGLHKKGF